MNNDQRAREYEKMHTQIVSMLSFLTKEEVEHSLRTNFGILGATQLMQTYDQVEIIRGKKPIFFTTLHAHKRKREAV